MNENPDKEIVNIQVFWGYDKKRLLGKATVKNEIVTMEITDPDFISVINGPNHLRNFSLGTVEFKREMPS
jgi:hypothetical protein